VEIGKAVFARVPIADQDCLETVPASMARVRAGFCLAVRADFGGAVEGVNRQPSR
jgi:hypothetical protein